MRTLKQQTRAAAAAPVRLAGLTLLGWREALRIARALAYDVALNSWHYTLSVCDSAAAAAERLGRRRTAERKS